MDADPTPGAHDEAAPDEPTRGSLEEDLAAVTRVLLGVEAPEPDEQVDPAEARRRAQVRQQQILDELRFLDD